MFTRTKSSDEFIWGTDFIQKLHFMFSLADFSKMYVPELNHSGN